ncbi:hypothetical protein T01_7550 [Trichinella spiralis]|uniref:Uncharacterized protein n=1 Tax=Trichinella spiralis TaxID=6334 RepID=A0A0V1AZB5_TRISP|nr:hypothetical protein T01_7550 [Trichinella spiralis]
MTRREIKGGKKQRQRNSTSTSRDEKCDEKQRIADKLHKPVTIIILDARAAQAIKLSYIPSGCAEESYLERLQIRIVYFPYLKDK